MARRIVLSDASPLITLAVVCGLPWLKQLFGTVHLSSIVRDEILTGAGLPGEKDIATAIRRGYLRVVEDRYAEPPFGDLDPGEASTLRLAVNVKRPARVGCAEVRSASVERCPGTDAPPYVYPEDWDGENVPSVAPGD